MGVKIPPLAATTVTPYNNPNPQTSKTAKGAAAMNKNITILVATAGQGVMRTSNNGQSWSRAGVDQGMHSDAIVRCLSTDPDNPQTVLAGTDKGLYLTPDAARTWQLLDTPLGDYSVWNLTRDPRNPNVIYAGTGTPTPAALFKSADRGQTWRKLPVQVAETCPNVGVPRFTGLAVDPHDQQRIWAGIEVDGVRHSSDGGNTWNDVNGAISNKDVHSLAITAGPPNPSSSSSTTAPSPHRTTATPGTAPSPAKPSPSTTPAASPSSPATPTPSSSASATSPPDAPAPSSAPATAARRGRIWTCPSNPTPPSGPSESTPPTPS